MAILKDSLITGDLRVTGTIYGDVPLNDLVDADDLKAIEALTGTSGLLKKTAANTWTLDTTAYKTGTVTSVRVQATSPVVSSVNTAQTSTLNTTISLADNYGDTKNPYASKTARYVLAAPASAAGAPTFRALTNADVGLSNVENTKLSTWTGSSNITTIGTLSSGTVPWANISNKPSQATAWPNWSQIQQTGAENISEGSSDVTDNTEIFTSYASNNGFADTNAPGKVYRRDVIKLYNYIKGKTDAVYLKLSGGTLTGALTLSGAPTANLHAATKQYVDQSFAANDAMIFKGTIGSSGATVTALPNTHSIGWTYRVLTAGTYAGVKCEIGDLIICIADGTAANNAHWTVAQTNIDGAVIGPSSVTSGHVVTFNGGTGKLIQDSGYTIASNVPANAKFTDTNYYHTTGSWSGLTYTATANGGAGALAFTIPTGTSATTVAVGNHTHTFASLTSKPTTLSGYGITDALGWHSTTSKSTELYDFGFYVNANAAAGTGPAGGNYFTILNLPYRKATGNTKADWGWQIGGSTNNDGRLFYRTTGDNVFDDWQEIAHAPRSSSNIGSATQPVYMTSAGVITAGTALKTLAYKDSIGNHSVTTPTGATSRTQDVTLKNNTAAKVTSEGTWPTLGTAFTIPNVTAAGTASYANGVLTITNTTTGTAFTVPNVTSIGIKPTFSTTTVAIDKQPTFTVTTQSTTLSHTIS